MTRFTVPHRQVTRITFVSTSKGEHDRNRDVHKVANKKETKFFSVFSEDYTSAEDGSHEGLGCIRALVGDTGAATSALSCGRNDRDNNNELKYLQDVLRLVDGSA